MFKILSSGADIRRVLRGQAAGGLLLVGAAVLAMLMANGGPALSGFYHHIFHAETGPVLAPNIGPMTLHLWINDGLMALFFLLVGLEIKREFMEGRLSDWARRGLPVVAALAGMAAPALVYLAFTRSVPHLHHGWAISSATDIAFALGVMGLLGSRVPPSLKLLLLTIAIVDDIGAVAIIAFFYTEGLNGLALVSGLAVWGIMLLLGRCGVRRLSVYLLLFAALWYAMLLSGVHATIAGILAALAIPLHGTRGVADTSDSPLHQPLQRLEHGLHPWCTYAIIPLFGFANAGVSLGGLGIGQLVSPLPLGVALGLFLGKQAGIFAAIWLAVKTGLAAMPRGATWVQVYGLSLLCGIGFTMSLFIGALAFPGQPVLVEEAKIGIVAGSLLSALAGFVVLRLAPLHPDYQASEEEQMREMMVDGRIAG